MQSFAILPAAGRSRRMGRPKLLLPWNGGTVIGRVLQTWRESRVSRVAVVVRADDADLQQACRGPRVDLVVPSQPPPEMKDSVLAGLRHVAERYRPRATDVWLLAPADMPRFQAATIDRLLDAHRPEAPAILVPQFAGSRGHPVVFPWPLAAEVPRLPDQEGIRRLLDLHPTRLVACPDADVLEDLDTPEDYDRLHPG